MKRFGICAALLVVGLISLSTEAAISHGDFTAASVIYSNVNESTLSIDEISTNFSMTFSPNADEKCTLLDDSGIGVIWTGDVNIDFESILAENNFGFVNGASLVNVALDNMLAVQTESGSLASIKKKSASGMTIEAIPEPGTATLLGGGSLFLISFRRKLSGLRHQRRTRTCGSYTRMIINHLLGKSVL